MSLKQRDLCWYETQTQTCSGVVQRKSRMRKKNEGVEKKSRRRENSILWQPHYVNNNSKVIQYRQP